MTNELDSYLKHLEREVRSKQYYLREAQRHIQNVRPITTKNEEAFDNLLERPTILPERGDSIGLSLAMTSLNERNISGVKSLNDLDICIDRLERKAAIYEKFNNDLQELLQELKRSKTDTLQIKSDQDVNASLWKELLALINEWFDDDGEAAQIIQDLIRSNGTIDASRFKQQTSSLLRLLMRSRLITLDRSSGRCLVQLANFQESFGS